MSDDLLLYGSKLNATDLQDALTHIFERNETLWHSGERGTPACIWGTHGLGKTQIVQDFARNRGWKLAYCAPAQFEEMGDLHGMPEVIDPTPEAPNSGDEFTVFRPPEWVPTEPGPGILLLDDINRADDRILRGLMQLLQNFAMFSWSLPARWQIVATANPEGGDYSVTPMDDAMLTRMLHLTLTFDPRKWAQWALSSGIDKRGIDFVLNYPEVVTCKRTTPRTLAQFFQQTRDIEDLGANQKLVEILGLSALDETTVASFLSFIKDDMPNLLDPMEILEAEEFSTIESRLKQIGEDIRSVEEENEEGETVVVEQKTQRVDRLATACNRLFVLLTSDSYQKNGCHDKNLLSLLLSETIPVDLRISLIEDLHREAGEEIQSMIRDPRIADMLGQDQLI